MTEQTEAELIAGLKAFREESFRIAVERYQDMAFNVAIGFTQRAEDAEDIAQEVFIEMYESIGGFRGDSKLGTWIYRIAVQKSLEHIRSKNRKKRFGFIQSIFGGEEQREAHDIADWDHPGILLENKQRARILFKAIEGLPENQKTAFTLHKLEGLSYAEIGEIMNTSLSSTESLMHRAKTSLRKTLKTYYDGSERVS